MVTKATECQICICSQAGTLHLHHIILRCDSRSTNKPNNLVTVCANCHNRIHKSEIICEGWYMTTDGLNFFHREAHEEIKIARGIILKPDGTADF